MALTLNDDLLEQIDRLPDADARRFFEALTPEERTQLHGYMGERRGRKAPQGAAVSAPTPGSEPSGVGSEGVSGMTALGRGAAQGATFGFADEINGLVQALGTKYLPESVGGGGELEKARSLADLYRFNRDSFRQGNQAASDQQGGLYLLGNVAGGLPASIAMGGGGGATLRSLVRSGAVQGATYGAGDSGADVLGGDVAGFLRDTTVGGAIGAGASGLGYGAARGLGAGANWVSQKASQKAAQAGAKLADLAKASAGEVTQQARSAAGTSATAAYKNATNIEEAIRAGAMALEDLTPDQLSLYRDLLRERAQKAARELVSDAARKTTKGAEYAQALANEPGRVAEALGRISNPMNQIMPRLQRYWMPLAGSAAGYIMGDSVGALAGLGAGGLAGRALSPTAQALARMAKHPAVQRPIWNSLAGLSRGAGSASGFAAPLGGQLGRTLTPEVEARLLPLFVRNEDEDIEKWAAAQ
jgi:hypothetical protein